MIDPSPQRLVQPWEADQVDRLLPSGSQWRRSSSTTLTVGGILSVLILAVLAQMLTPESAFMAVAAAAWAFLTLAHLIQGSPGPRWSSLVPVTPLAALIAISIFVGPGEMGSYALVKKLGALAGFAAFGAAAHLSIQRPSVGRQVLWSVAVLGIFFVGMTSVTRIFAEAPPATTSPSLASILEILGRQPDLVAVSLMCLGIGLGMTLESLQEGQGPSAGTLIAFIPLAAPLGASRFGSSIAGVFFALAVLLVISRCRSATGLDRIHFITIGIGAVLTILCFTQAWFSKHPFSNGDHHLHDLWQMARLRPPFGQLEPLGPVPASDLVRGLLAYGYAGLLLIALSLVLFAHHRFRTNPGPSLLSFWCWIAAAVVSGIALWHAPLEHPLVPLMGILLLVCACGNLNLPGHTSRHSPPPTGDEELPSMHPTVERISSEGSPRSHASQEIPTAPPDASASGSDRGSLGEPIAPIDPRVRILRRRRR